MTATCHAYKHTLVHSWHAPLCGEPAETDGLCARHLAEQARIDQADAIIRDMFANGGAEKIKAAFLRRINQEQS